MWGTHYSHWVLDRAGFGPMKPVKTHPIGGITSVNPVKSHDRVMQFCP
jgi:hypothetical protein